MARLVITLVCILFVIGQPGAQLEVRAATTVFKPQQIVKPNITVGIKPQQIDHKNITVSSCQKIQFASPAMLPSGKVGKPYRYMLRTTTPQPNATYQLINGELPDSLKLDSQGIISGFAKVTGIYQFVIRVSSSCPTHSNHVDGIFTLHIVDQEQIPVIKVRPAALKVVAGEGLRQTIEYTCNNLSADGARLYSPGAKFLVNKKIIGEVEKTLNVHLTGNNNRISEGITVPKALIEKAVGMGAHQISYIRTFAVREKQTRQTVEVTIAIVPDEPGKQRTLNLVQPVDGNAVEYRALDFRWQNDLQIASYRIEFCTADDSKVLFSDTTKEAAYTLSDEMVNDRFDDWASYRWKIKGLDKQGRVIARSADWGFRFKPAGDFLPGQIIVISRGSRTAKEAADFLGKKYDLHVVEFYALESLKHNVTVFSTSRNVMELIKQISKEPQVIQAQPNHVFTTLSEPQQDLQHVYQTLHLASVHKQLKGSGVRVAIVDTGVDIHHRDLSARVVKHVNLVKHDQYRGEIHGTAMAGVVLASINQFGIAGVAPQADLIALRACRQISENHPEGRCTTTSVSKALDMAITQKAQIVNMSFGASVPDFLLIQLFNEGAKRNVLFVASVGNQQDTTEISFPASHPKVISVAGVDDRGNGYPNTALASAARVCAPAKEVLTTLPGDRFNIMSGTSISAAVVSGILALAKEKNGRLSIQTLPDYQGDLCLWQQELFNLPVCK